MTSTERQGPAVRGPVALWEGTHEVVMQVSWLGQDEASKAPRFRVLGGVSVEGAAAGPPQERALLGILLLHPGQVVSTVNLMDALWGDEPPRSAVHSIQVHVSELRRRLGADTIETTPSGYRLTIDPYDIDWCRFERAFRDAESEADPSVRQPLLADALTLWTGDPLADVVCLLATDVGQQRLTELRLVAFEQWARACIEQGDVADLIPDLRSLAREHPLHEPLWECLMEALAIEGRQPEALRAYTQLQHHLGEVGLEPTAKLRATEERILLDEAEPPHGPSRMAQRSPRLRFLAGVIGALVITAVIAWRVAPNRMAFLLLDPWTTERTDLHTDALEEIGDDVGVEVTVLGAGDAVLVHDVCGPGNVVVLAGPSSHEHAAIAEDCPHTHFVALDVEPAVEASAFFAAPNITVVVIDTEEAAFLAGSVAARESRTGTLGFVGGMPIPTVDRLLAGFEAGALWAEPDTVILATYLGLDPTVGLGAFDSPELGYDAALDLFRADVDIVFHAAGGSGQGILEAVVASSTLDRPLRFIGVELDARALATVQQQPYVLTSAITRLDVAIGTVLQRHVDGSLDGSPIHLGLADGVVRVSQGGAAVGAHAGLVDAATALIASGEIEVPLSPSPGVVYLEAGAG